MKQSQPASVRERSHSLRERSDGLRSDAKQLREAVNKNHALVASRRETASAAEALNASRPAKPLNSLDFAKVRKTREQAKAIRGRASELRKKVNNGLYMQRAGERASGMREAADAAATSSERHQAEGQQMRNHADRCKYELDKAEDRTQRRSDAKSNQLQIPSALPQVQFILNELSIGLTLSTLAGKLQGEPKTRSRSKARAAYDAALRFADRVPLTREESQKVYTALEALRRSLETLGESF